MLPEVNPTQDKVASVIAYWGVKDIQTTYKILIRNGTTANEEPSLFSTKFYTSSPGVELEFNMVKFFRIGLGAYYRYTSDINLSAWNGTYYTDVSPDLKGFSFGISLKFGKF